MELANFSTFWYMQNTYFYESGGEISFAKALWLGMTILYWFIIPIMIICTQKEDRAVRMIYSIFLINMLLRAVIELILMYEYNAWKYEYGLGHNIFSFILLAGLIIFNKQPKILLHTAILMLIMFIAESYFAYYMIEYVRDHYMTDDIWFISWNVRHMTNNVITIFMLLILCLWQSYFYLKWVKNAK
jgi:hypothetical protein